MIIYIPINKLFPHNRKRTFLSLEVFSFEPKKEICKKPINKDLSADFKGR